MSSKLCVEPSAVLPVLTVHTWMCIPDSNIFIKFADDTAVVALISHSDGKAYRTDAIHLEKWWWKNNFLLNVRKTKELVVDFSRKEQRDFHPLWIRGSEVERVHSFKYFGMTITAEVCWLIHIKIAVNTTTQHPLHLRRQRDFKLPLKVLRNFETCPSGASCMWASPPGWAASSSRTSWPSKQWFTELSRISDCPFKFAGHLHQMMQVKCWENTQTEQPPWKLFSLLPLGWCITA